MHALCASAPRRLRPCAHRVPCHPLCLPCWREAAGSLPLIPRCTREPAPCPPSDARRARVCAQTVAAAVKAGTVSYIVKVSVTGARGPDTEPKPGLIPSIHWAGEEVMRKSGIANTAIRPNIFWQHFTTFPQLFTRGNDKFYLPTGDAKIAWTDTRDIAALAAALIMGDGRTAHNGQAYELTGADALTAAQSAALISAAAGKDIAHVDGEEAFVARCAELGLPDMLKHVYHEAGGGWFGEVKHEPFTAVVGRTPRTFAVMTADHADFFKQ